MASFHAEWRARLDDLDRNGRASSDKDLVITGARGNGKSLAAKRLVYAAEHRGYVKVEFDPSSGGPLLVNLAKQLTEAREDHRKRPVLWGLRFWKGFAWGKTKVSPVPGVVQVEVPQMGDQIAGRPAALAEELAEADAEIRQRQHGHGGIVLAIHDLHNLPPHELAQLDATLHVLNDRYPDARITMVATGQSSLKRICRGPDAARPHLSAPKALTSEVRLPSRLSPRDAAEVLQQSAHRAGKHWTEDALRRAYAITEGNPAHLGYLSSVVLRQTDRMLVEPQVVRQAAPEAQRKVDENYAEEAWKAMNNNVEGRKYLIALSQMSPTTELTDMAAALGGPAGPRDLEEVRALTDRLIESGHVESDDHGHLSLAVPGLRQHIKNVREPGRRGETAAPDRQISEPRAITQTTSEHPDPKLAATERAATAATSPWIKNTQTSTNQPTAADRIKAVRDRLTDSPTPTASTSRDDRRDPPQHGTQRQR